MTDQKFMITVKGELVAGISPDQAKQNVAKMFKTTVDKVTPMFSGHPVVVKKGVDKKTAAQYLTSLKQAGLVAKATPMPAAGNDKAPPRQNRSVNQAPPSHTGTGNLTMAEVGADVTDYTPPPEPNIDISKLSMADAGEDIMEHESVPAPNIDTSSLSLDDSNS